MAFSLKDNEVVGIDLGTSNIRIFLKGRGIVLDEPSIVAMDNKKSEIVGVGKNAQKLLRRNADHLEMVHPLCDGVIADYISAEKMIKDSLDWVCNKGWLSKPGVVVSMPPGITGVEKRAIKQAVLNAGGQQVLLVPAPILAGLGADLDVMNGSGMMVVDVGGGTTDIAILSYGGIVASKSIRVGGNKFNKDLIVYISNEYNMMITDTVAEEIKLNIGTAFLYNRLNDRTMSVMGIDIVTGEPKTIILTSKETEDAFSESVEAIYLAVKGVMQECPPELGWDIIDKGIIMTGGGSLLDSLLVALSRALNISVQAGENPMCAVALGAGYLLKNATYLKKSSAIQNQD